MRDRLIELLKNAKYECLLYSSDGCFACSYKEQEDCTLECVADHILANGVTVQEWISVKDRLPDKPMKCLVYTIGEDIGRFDIAYYGGHYDGFSVLYGTVTHWMPLPPAPKGE